MHFFLDFLDSTRHLWWHILVVIVPPEVDYSNTPFLWITDGDNGNDAIPDELNYNLLIAADIALQTKVDLSQETFFVPCRYRISLNNVRGH